MARLADETHTADTAAAKDWPAQQADRVVAAVERIRSLTTDRAIVAARTVVFGLVISVLALAALILVVIISVRLADAYLPIGAGVGDATWAAHGFVGAAFTVLGIGAWASRHGEGAPKPLYVSAGVVGLALVVLIVFGIAAAVYQ